MYIRGFCPDAAALSAGSRQPRSDSQVEHTLVQSVVCTIVSAIVWQSSLLILYLRKGAGPLLALQSLS